MAFPGRISPHPLPSTVQSLSCVQLFAIPRQASLSFTISRSLRKLMFIELVHFILCCPLLLLPTIFPSIRVPPYRGIRHLLSFSAEWHQKPPPCCRIEPSQEESPGRDRELVWGHGPRTQLWCPFSALLRVKMGSLPFALGLPGALGVSLRQSSASTAWGTSLPAPPLPPPLWNSTRNPPPPHIAEPHLWASSYQQTNRGVQ